MIKIFITIVSIILGIFMMYFGVTNSHIILIAGLFLILIPMFIDIDDSLKYCIENTIEKKYIKKLIHKEPMNYSKSLKHLYCINKKYAKYLTVEAYEYYLKKMYATMQIHDLDPVLLVELMYWTEERAKAGYAAGTYEEFRRANDKAMLNFYMIWNDKKQLVRLINTCFSGQNRTDIFKQ